MTKSKTFQIGTGRGERGPKKEIAERVDSALNGFYAANPGISVVSKALVLTPEGNVIVSVSYEESNKK